MTLILLEADFVLKAINVFVLSNIDFDGFTRSHKNKHQAPVVRKAISANP